MTEHIVVSRLAIKWLDHPNAPSNWNKWVEDRMSLWNDYTLPSLAAQTCQNFTLITLVDESVVYTPMLENEVVIHLKSDGSYPKVEILNSINMYVQSLGEEVDSVITTRLDSDDMLEHDFIQNVQSNIKMNDYLDIAQGMTYNTQSGQIKVNSKYDRIISPFVSVMESANDYLCIPMRFQHSDIGAFCEGRKLSELKAIQVIHGQNLINKESGIRITDFKYNNWGLK